MSDSPYKNVTHCIFDMDGLLLDTETLYTEAYNRVIQQYGKVYTWEHKVQIMGFKGNEAAKTLIDILELPVTQQDFENQLQNIYPQIFPGCNMMPGAEKLLRHLKDNKIPIALATSSCQESSDLKTQKWKQVFELFDHKVFGGSDPEVSKGKPNPDIFIVAAGRFPDNPSPSKCLVFEDSPNGVEAALAAGMQVVMVPDPNLPKNLTEKGTLVIKSLEDFKPESFGLPPFST